MQVKKYVFLICGNAKIKMDSLAQNAEAKRVINRKLVKFGYAKSVIVKLQFLSFPFVF